MTPLEQLVKIDDTLNQIKGKILEKIPGAEILLFGSRAQGLEKRNSDYDLLIITDFSTDNTARLHFQSMIRKQLTQIGILADVIVQSHSDLEIKKHLPGHIVRTALQEGIEL